MPTHGDPTMFTDLSSASTLVSAVTPGDRTYWGVTLPPLLMESPGLLIRQFNIPLQLRLTSSLYYSGIGTSGKTRYTNPDEVSAGYYQVLDGTLVTDYGRLRYAEQQIDLPVRAVMVSGGRADAPIQLGRNIRSEASYSQSTGDIGICTSIEGIVVPPPGVSPMVGQSTIGRGNVVLKNLPAVDRYSQLDDYVDGVTPGLPTSLADWGLPDGASGVLYPGWQGIIKLSVGYNRIEVAGQLRVQPDIIGSTPIPPTYSYVCLGSVPAGLPGNPPCGPNTLVLSYNPDGTVASFSCGSD